MKKEPLAIAYAQALLELAEERKELDTVLEEVRFFRDLLATDQDFRTFVVTPGIEAADKKDVLDKVFSGHLTATLLDFTQVVVVEKGRSQLLESMLEVFCGLYDEKMGRVHVDAVTAEPLSQERQDQLTESLSKKLDKTVLLDNPVQPEIIGGLMLRYGDLVIDGSIRTRIKTLSSRIADKKLGSELIHED